MRLELSKPLLRQVLAFGLVGGLCYLISILLLMGFVEIAGVAVTWANVWASLITIIVCYFLNAAFVFKSGRHSRFREMMGFALVSFAGFGINIGVMYWLTTYTSMWYVLSKTLVVGVVAVFNFLLRKYVIFLE